MRLQIIRVVIIILFIVILGDLFYVQIFKGNLYYRLSTNNRIRVVPLEGWRGRIKDRNGMVLADNTISYDVVVTPQDIAYFDQVFQYISDVLGKNKEKFIKRYRQRKSAPFAPVAVAENIPRAKAIIIEENKYRFPSMMIQKGFKRLYPYGKDSAHVLGFVGKVNLSDRERFQEYGYSPLHVVGKLGAEEYYNSFLKGSEGGIQVEVNSRGQQVRLLSYKAPQKGQDISLTIDVKLQQLLTSLLDSRPGAIVIMDKANGEILGMVSSPAYDPNTRTTKDPRSPFLNRVIQGLYPPGSVFKILVAIAALDKEKITKHTTFICNGYHEVGNRHFRCTHVHGPQNMFEAIGHSCNVYFYRIGLILGADIIGQYAHLFGLGQVTHIDLPYEKSGYVPYRNRGILSRRKRWYAGDTLNYSIGQGDLLTTPLQLLHVMATVANEGRILQPHVLKSVMDHDVEDFNFSRELKISSEIFDAVKQGMRATVKEFSGTAHELHLSDIRVSGKTGTAQTSGNKEDHAWFVGYTSGRGRDIVFCVFLEHGGSSHNANLIAREMLIRMKTLKLF